MKIIEFKQASFMEKISGRRQECRARPGDGTVVRQRLLGTVHVILRLQPVYLESTYGSVLMNVINETDLVEARLAAEETNRVNGEFLSTMSHDIRTPMNAIIGVAELLFATQLTDEQHN